MIRSQQFFSVVADANSVWINAIYDTYRAHSPGAFLGPRGLCYGGTDTTPPIRFVGTWSPRIWQHGWSVLSMYHRLPPAEVYQWLGPQAWHLSRDGLQRVLREDEP